jgi:hypothetical protein
VVVVLVVLVDVVVLLVVVLVLVVVVVVVSVVVVVVVVHGYMLAAWPMTVQLNWLGVSLNPSKVICVELIWVGPFFPFGTKTPSMTSMCNHSATEAFNISVSR